MNVYLLASCAWSVRKGIYSGKRFSGMIESFKLKLEKGYKKCLNSKLNSEDIKSLKKGYKLYKEGLKQLKKGDPLLLLQGLCFIEKGMTEFKNKSYAGNFHKYVIMEKSE